MLFHASTNLLGILFGIVLSPFGNAIAFSFFIHFTSPLSIFNIALTFFLAANNRAIVIKAKRIVDMFKNLGLFEFKKPSS